MKRDKCGLTVVRVDKENEDTTSIFFSGPGIKNFKKHKAGQFATIRVFRDGAWSDAHPFTLSGAPGEEELRMTIKKSGAFTNTVPELEVGTPIQCAGPFGRFCEGIELKQKIVMIAGGVGITPFLSVLRDFRKHSVTNEVLLFWANKTPRDAFAAAELEDMTRTLALHVVHAFSRVPLEQQTAAPAFTDGRPGRVSFEYGRLDQAKFSRYIPAADAAFYLCGPPTMQAAILDELRKCGVPPESVQKEAFVFTTPKRS